MHEYFNILDIDGVLVSGDLLRERFCCDYDCCCGVCCKEGDAGAPITPEESNAITKRLPEVEGSLEPEAREVLESQGVSYIDPRGNLATSIISTGECVFALKDPKGRYYCAIQDYKPISCSLYPIRVKQLGSDITALNYSEWDICSAAKLLGKKNDVSLYRFLEGPLKKRFGEKWYETLCRKAEELKAI